MHVFTLKYLYEQNVEINVVEITIKMNSLKALNDKEQYVLALKFYDTSRYTEDVLVFLFLK